MLIFIYGEDSYRSRLKLNEIVEKYKKTNKGEVRDFDFEGKDIDFNQFKNEFLSLSIFQESKLFILRGAFFAKEFKEKFLKGSKDFINSKNFIIFYETGKILESSLLFKFLKKEAQCQEFKLLTLQQLKLWAKKEFEKYGAKINQPALEKLILSQSSSNLWKLSGEILKLVNFRKDIEENDIEQLVEVDEKADIFKTIDFVVQRNKKQSLFAIRNHLDKGESPLYLFSMINFQFRNLLLVKSYENDYSGYDAQRALASKLKMHPYVVKKSLSQAANFSEQELRKIYHQIFKLDMDMKTGKIKPEVALEIFVASI